MNVLHCPNPLCTKTFSAADVQRPGNVTCPSCGQEFRFRPPGKPPVSPSNGQNETAAHSSAPTRLDPPPTKPVNYPWQTPAIPAPRPPTPPVAPPIAPVAKVLTAAPVAFPPLAKPVPPPPAAPPAPPRPAHSDKIVHLRGLAAPRSRHPFVKFIVVTLVIGMFVGAVFYGIYTIGPSLQFPKNDGHQTGAGAPSYIFYARNHRGNDEKAFSLAIDKDAWSADKEMKNRLKALAVFKRTDRDVANWFAIAVQDFGFRKPREGELVNGASERLRALFGDSLQLDSNRLEAAKIGGLDASRCRFEGKNNVAWKGECYLVPHHGFAYWVLIAGPTYEDAQQQFAELEGQKAFAFTTDRRGWTEQPPELDIFFALNNAFQVRTPDRIWQKNDPKTEDENGVLYLAGFFQSLQNQSPEKVSAKNATLVGLALDKKSDLHEAYKDAVAYLQRKKQEESKDYKFEPNKEGASLNGELGDVGDQPGCIGEMILSRGSEKMRYVLLAVFNDSSKTYGLRFECAWADQAIWRKEFRDLIKTVQLGQK